MANGKIYVDDVGTIFEIDTESDLTGYTKAELAVFKPDGSVEAWTGGIVSGTTITYTTVSGDLDQAGAWRLQADVAIPGWSGRGETVRFTVYEDFE